MNVNKDKEKKEKKRVRNIRMRTRDSCCLQKIAHSAFFFFVCFCFLFYFLVAFNPWSMTLNKSSRHGIIIVKVAYSQMHFWLLLLSSPRWWLSCWSVIEGCKSDSLSFACRSNNVTLVLYIKAHTLDPSSSSNIYSCICQKKSPEQNQRQLYLPYLINSIQKL